jgi:hypothetical protein
MKKTIYSFLAVGLLSACSTVINNQTPHMTIKTPGATNARCLIENQDMKYMAFSDQKIEIMKSPHDLVVRCQAAGNRERTVHVKREIDDWVVANVANGFVPGAAYDYFSRGAFTYPETITVSFVGEPIKPYPLPAYMQKDVMPNAENSQIEYLGPSEVITEDNRVQEAYDLKRIGNPYAVQSAEETPNVKSERPTNLHQRYNPSVSYDPSEEDK